MWDTNLGLAKSDTVLQTARHRSDISSRGAALLRCNDAGTGLANLFTIRRNSVSTEKDLIMKIHASVSNVALKVALFKAPCSFNDFNSD